MTTSTSAGEMIAIGKNAMVEQLASAWAGKFFSNEVNNSITVDTIMTQNEQTQLIKILGYAPIFSNRQTVLHEHRVAYALRQIEREQLHNALALSDSITTLFIGCSAYEISNVTLYDNQAYYFSVHGSEAKDVSRISPAVIKKLITKIKSKITVDEKRVLAGLLDKEPSRRVLRIDGLQKLLAALHSGDYRDVPRVGIDIFPKVSRIASFDSNYNWESEDYVKAFVETGANEMFCLMLLPEELLFPHMPENELYAVRHYRGKGDRIIEFGEIDDDSWSAISFRHGYSDGYVHKHKAWTTLYREKYIAGPGFFLNIEIVSSAGPMRLIKLTKNESPRPSFRMIEIPRWMQFVRILDMEASYNRDPNFKDLVYFSVNADNWWRVTQYMVSLDPKSITAHNAFSYIRRCKGGIKMAGVAYHEKWYMPEDRMVPMAIAALVHAQVAIDATNTVVAAYTEKREENNFWRIMSSITWGLFAITTLGVSIPGAMLVKWFKKKELAHKIVLTPDMTRTILVFPQKYWDTLKQEEATKYENVFQMEIGELIEGPDAETGAKFDKDGRVIALPRDGDCQLCAKVAPKLGVQVLKCDYERDSEVEWKMTREEVIAFKVAIDTESKKPECHGPLHETLKKCLAFIPSVEMTWKGRVENVKAGPGCGKSYLARELYNEESMIVAPFNKLKSDYTQVPDPENENEPRDMLFKTTHKAMEALGRQILIVDEWTSLDWRVLLICARNNGAKKIYLCGDEGQSRIRKNEGEYIGDHLPQDRNLTTHTLCVNFRNPKYIVALLNKNFGYHMRAESKEIGIPKFEPLEGALTQLDKHVLNLSHLSGRYNVNEETNSVRSNQGGTFDHVGLVISDDDDHLIDNHNLLTVAISRHKKSLTIYVRPGSEMDYKMRAKLLIDDKKFQDEFMELSNPSFSEMASDPEEKHEGLGSYLQKVVLGSKYENGCLITEEMDENGDKFDEIESNKKEDFDLLKEIKDDPIFIKSTKSDNSEILVEEADKKRNSMTFDQSLIDTDLPEKNIKGILKKNEKGKKTKKTENEVHWSYGGNSSSMNLIMKETNRRWNSLTDDQRKKYENDSLVEVEDISGFKDEDVEIKDFEKSKESFHSEKKRKGSKFSEFVRFGRTLTDNVRIKVTGPSGDNIENKVLSDQFCSRMNNESGFINQETPNKKQKLKIIQSEKLAESVGKCDLLPIKVGGLFGKKYKCQCPASHHRKVSEVPFYKKFDFEKFSNRLCSVFNRNSNIVSKECFLDEPLISENDIKWCTAEAMEGQISSELIERYKSYVKSNRKSFVTKEGLVKVSAVQTFCRDEEINLAYYDKNYKRKMTFYGNKGVLHLQIIKEHTIKVPEWLVEKKSFSYHNSIVRMEPWELHNHSTAKKYSSEQIGSWISKSEEDPVVAINIEDNDVKYAAYDHLEVDIDDLSVWLRTELDNNQEYELIDKELRNRWEPMHKQIITAPMELIGKDRKLSALRVMLRIAGITIHVIDGETLETLVDIKPLRGLTLPVFLLDGKLHVAGPDKPRGKFITYEVYRGGRRIKFEGLLHQVCEAAKGESCNISVPWMIKRAKVSSHIKEHFFADIGTGVWKAEPNMVLVPHIDAPPGQRLIMETIGMVYLREDHVPAEIPNVETPHKERAIHPSSNAYLYADTFSPVFAIEKDCLNEEVARQGFLNVPRVGEFHPDWLNPVNSRGHPKNLERRAYKGQALCIGEGLRYDGSNNLQVLQTVAHRYFRKRKVFKYNPQAEALANEIADTFVRECQNPLRIDPHKEADIVREWELDAKKRKYEERRLGEGEFDTMTIRHHLKDIFKPLKDRKISDGNNLLDELVNTFKAGQGISAWSAEATIAYGAFTRILNHRWLSCLKDNIVYNNKYSEAEIDDQLSYQKKYTLWGAKTGVTDGADFDSMQNRFTQQIERRHSYHLGVSKTTLDGYYAFRNDYMLKQNGVFKGRCRSEKTSGEPGTLLYNSQLGGSVNNFVLRGVGPFTMAIQGDDAKKTQVGLVEDKEAMARIKKYSDFELKTKIGRNQEFCGCVEVEGTLVPSIHRIFKKLSGHTYKNEQHFMDYKMSLLDKVNRVEQVGHQITVAASAAAAGVDYDEMDHLYDSVKSFSHLSWDQFNEKSIPIRGITGTPSLIL